MRSDLPKVLQPLAGQPLLLHVLEQARELAPEAIHVVYGHGGERVRAACLEFAAGSSLHWAHQEQQLGTGHALAQAIPSVPDAHLLLVLYGDVPLLRAETLRALIELAGTDAIALLTTQLADPSGYGRILRDRRGRLPSVVQVDWQLLADGARPGDTLVAAVRDAQVTADTRVWAAGEAAAMQRIRRHLFEERGLPRPRAVIRGYWKTGSAGDSDATPE